MNGEKILVVEILLLLALQKNSVKIVGRDPGRTNKVAKKDEFIGKQTFGVNIICFKEAAQSERQFYSLNVSPASKLVKRFILKTFPKAQPCLRALGVKV